MQISSRFNCIQGSSAVRALNNALPKVLSVFIKAVRQRDVNYFYALPRIQIPSCSQSGHFPLPSQGERDVWFSRAVIVVVKSKAKTQ